MHRGRDIGEYLTYSGKPLYGTEMKKILSVGKEVAFILNLLFI